MSSQHSSTISETMPPITTTAFSYAQAAKGRAPTPNAAPPSSNPIPPRPSSVSTDASNTQPAAKVTLSTKTETRQDATKAKAINAEPSSESAQKPTIETAPALESAPKHDSNPQLNVEPGRRQDDDAATERSTRWSERSVRSSSTPSHGPDDADAKKSRRNKKGKAGDRDTTSQDESKDGGNEAEKEQAKTELFEAPIPTVNFWAARKEAATKARQSIVSPGISTPIANEGPAAGESLAKVQEAGKKGNQDDGIDAATAGQNGTYVNGSKGQRKVTEGDAAPPRRSGPRGSRVVDKENRRLSSETVAAVEDVAAWPTPETAVQKEKRKSMDRLERSEKDGADVPQTKLKGKNQWVQVPFVPTATFNTPNLPTRGRGRGGGRGGGRNESGRGGHGGNGDKSANAGPAAAKLSAESRDRAREAPQPTRAASLPPNGGNRTSISGPPPRKPSATVIGERTREPPPFTSGQVSPFSSQYHLEQRINRGIQDQTQPLQNRQEGRSDRGGRGGMRGGRGGHQPLNVQATYQNGGPWANGGAAYPMQGTGQPRYPTSLYSPTTRQNPFAPFVNSPQRPSFQAPQQQMQQQIQHQMPQQMPQPRNMHGPARGGNTNGLTGRAPAINTGAPFYSSYMPPAAPMQYGVPDYWEATKSLIILQIDYYFSVDNLVKDLWLRQRMDSQGYVLFDTIASFRRMQAISSDIELIRAACADAMSIDFVQGQDGRDRLRRRVEWQPWVLDMNDRHEHGKSDGPGFVYHKSNDFLANQSMMPEGYIAASPAYYTPNGAGQEFQGFHSQPQLETLVNGYANDLVNGMTNGNGHVQETQLSATVPEFSPQGLAGNGLSFGAGPQFAREEAQGVHHGLPSDDQDIKHESPSQRADVPLLVNGTNGYAGPNYNTETMAPSVNGNGTHSGQEMNEKHGTQHLGADSS
jgi:la-related protein 1